MDGVQFLSLCLQITGICHSSLLKISCFHDSNTHACKRVHSCVPQQFYDIIPMYRIFLGSEWSFGVSHKIDNPPYSKTNESVLSYCSRQKRKNMRTLWKLQWEFKWWLLHPIWSNSRISRWVWSSLEGARQLHLQSWLWHIMSEMRQWTAC